MKYILITAILFSIGIPLMGAEKERTTTKPRVGTSKHPVYNGKVKSVENPTYYVRVKFGEPVRGEISSGTRHKYAQSGQNIEAAIYRGKTYWVNGKTNLKYDSKGRLTEEIMSSRDLLEAMKAPFKESFKKTHSYDENENKAQSSTFWFRNGEWEFDGKTVFNYDKEGRLEETLIYKRNETVLAFRRKNKYDKNGLLVDSRLTLPNGDIYSRETRKYNADGRILEDVVYGVQYLADVRLVSRGDVRLKNTYSYDKDGRKTEEVVRKIIFNKDNFPTDKYSYFKYKNIYGENGKIHEKLKYDKIGNLNIRRRYHYEKDGHRVEVFSDWYAKENKLELESVEFYDARGNMVKKVSHRIPDPLDKSKYIQWTEEIWEFTYWD